MANNYISLISGIRTVLEAIITSAGAGDSGKIVALDANGRLDESMLPVGIGADTASILASETLAAGDFVDIYDNTGTATCRKADVSATGKTADGFVLAGATSGNNATIYFEGQNNQLTGLTAGVSYFSSPTVPGGVTATAPSTSGQVVQFVGVAINATTINTDIDLQGITLA
jgi:hypothetical protein